VNGPGSFTAMRIITLTINTLSFVHPVPLYDMEYFTLGVLSGWSFPILIRANRGEYLIQKIKNTPPELISISDIPRGNYF
jgi:tRNA A37 threonylcarbamoyladenosine modification protein TsaB